MSEPEILVDSTRERGSTSEGPVHERISAPPKALPRAGQLRELVRSVWSSSDFDGTDLTRFAEPVMRNEAQQGVFVLGTLTMLLMAGLALMYYSLQLGTPYIYTFSLLAALSGHTAVSAKVVTEIKVLYLLGMVLLAGCGLAFMLLAHRYGVFSSTLFSTVVVLFMVVPLVSWGLREALYATGIVYVIFTASTLSAVKAFTTETLWTLQFLMITSALIALTVVVRAVLIRKAHVEARFELTKVNEELYDLSHRDALTGAWNRHFLEEQFNDIVERYAEYGQEALFCLIDIDDFKKLNDTHGHPCGDRVLQHLVRVLTGELRFDEYVVRMGGDEFAILLHGDHANQRLELALQRFRLGNKPFAELSSLPHVSVGLTKLATDGSMSLEESYPEADKALYMAKVNSLRAHVEAGPLRGNPS